MKKDDQTEIDLKLHEFGQRMRAAWAERQTDFEKNIAAFREGVQEDWQVEHAKIEAPKIEGPEIKGPKIQPCGDTSKNNPPPSETLKGLPCRLRGSSTRKYSFPATQDR